MSDTYGLEIKDEYGDVIYSTRNATWLLLDNFILGKAGFYEKDYSHLTEFKQVSVQMQMLENAPDNQEGYAPDITINGMYVKISPRLNANTPISTTNLTQSGIYFIPDNPYAMPYPETYLWTMNKQGKYLGTINTGYGPLAQYEQIAVYEYKKILPRYTDMYAGTIVIPSYSYVGYAGYYQQTTITV